MIPKSGSGLSWTALRAALVKAYYTGQIRPIKLSASHFTFAHPFCSIPSCSDFDSGPNLTCQLRKKPNTQHGHLLLFASSSFSSCVSDWGWNTGPMILSVIFFSTCQSSAIVHSRISFCCILIIHPRSRDYFKHWFYFSSYGQYFCLHIHLQNYSTRWIWRGRRRKRRREWGLEEVKATFLAAAAAEQASESWLTLISWNAISPHDDTFLVWLGLMIICQTIVNCFDKWESKITRQFHIPTFHNILSLEIPRILRLWSCERVGRDDRIRICQVPKDKHWSEKVLGARTCYP